MAKQHDAMPAPHGHSFIQATQSPELLCVRTNVETQMFLNSSSCCCADRDCGVCGGGGGDGDDD